MDIDLIRSELINEKCLKEIIYLDEVDSTNSFAKSNNLAGDTLVLTSYQTKGTGRFSRPWKSDPHKDLTFSIVKNFEIRLDEIHLVNFYSSLTMCRILKLFFSKYDELNFCLKWPNDILLNKKKVAGFLLDVKNLKSDFKKFIIGIGVNVNHNEFDAGLKDKAVSLLEHTRLEIKIEDILIKFIKNFYENISLIEKREELMKEWILNSDLIGRSIKFRKMDDESENSAMVLDIETDGSLKLKFENGSVNKFYSGEVSIEY